MKADNLEVQRTLEALAAEKSVLQAQVCTMSTAGIFAAYSYEDFFVPQARYRESEARLTIAEFG